MPGHAAAAALSSSRITGPHEPVMLWTTRRFTLVLAATSLVLGSGCTLPTGAETRSLLGEPLYPPEVEPSSEASITTQLRAATAAWQRDPTDLDHVIRYGRLTALSGHYREAIDIFTEGLRLHPQSPRLFRHRGHRYLTLREFEMARDDLRQAKRLTENSADMLEESATNANGARRTTLHFNIGFLLGLADYMEGDYESAERTFLGCRGKVRNDDQRVALTNWHYLTLRRLGNDGQAIAILDGIERDMDVRVNRDDHRLCLMYSGELSAEALETSPGSAVSAIGYGVAAHSMLESDLPRAVAGYEAITARGDWPALGHMAAEADLARHIRYRGN